MKRLPIPELLKENPERFKVLLGRRGSKYIPMVDRILSLLKNRNHLENQLNLLRHKRRVLSREIGDAKRVELHLEKMRKGEIKTINFVLCTPEQTEAVKLNGKKYDAIFNNEMVLLTTSANTIGAILHSIQKEIDLPVRALNVCRANEVSKFNIGDYIIGILKV